MSTRRSVGPRGPGLAAALVLVSAVLALSVMAVLVVVMAAVL